MTRNSPRQADVILVNGTITYKMAPVLRRLYDQMADPKYVVAIGGCAVAGGPFTKSYHVVKVLTKSSLLMFTSLVALRVLKASFMV